MSKLYEQMFANYCSYHGKIQNFTFLVGGGGFDVSKDRCSYSKKLDYQVE